MTIELLFCVTACLAGILLWHVFQKLPAQQSLGMAKIVSRQAG
jgi:hypothetical protein